MDGMSFTPISPIFISSVLCLALSVLFLSRPYRVYPHFVLFLSSLYCITPIFPIFISYVLCLPPSVLFWSPLYCVYPNCPVCTSSVLCLPPFVLFFPPLYFAYPHPSYFYLLCPVSPGCWYLYPGSPTCDVTRKPFFYLDYFNLTFPTPNIFAGMVRLLLRKWSSSWVKRKYRWKMSQKWQRSSLLFHVWRLRWSTLLMRVSRWKRRSPNN